MTTRTIKAGTTDVSVVIRIVDSTDGTPETGVVFNTSGIDLEYRRELAASVDITEATLAALTTAHADGGFLHIGNGYYRLDLPDAACAAGATGVLVHGTVTGMVVIGCYIELVAYDPADTVRLGLTALPNAAAEAAGGLFTRGTGAGQINQAANGMIDTNPVRLNNVSQSLLDLKDFADDGYDPATNKVEGVKLADTLTTYTGNTPQTGDGFARLGAPAGASVSADIAAIEAQTDDIGVAGAGLTAVPWNAAWDAEVESEVDDALGGGTGTALTAIPWNAAWDAEVQSEVDDALVVQRLDELLNADSDVDGAAPPTVGSVFHELMSKTAGSFTYDQTTDSNEAIRDNMGTPQTGDVFPLASTEIADIKAKTDQLTFTTANQLDSNVKGVSDDSAAADAFETMLDGTGGQTLSLGKLDINNPSGDAISAVSSGGAGRGIYAKGEGAGHGALIEGGGAAHGIYGKGGSSAGSGLRGDGAGASAGIAGVGATGPGIHGLGGTNSHGLLVQSAVGGDGIRAIGEGVGHGARFTKGASGKDIDADEIDQIVTDTTTDIPALIAALNNLSSAQAQTAAAAALTAYDPPTRTEATSDKDEILTQLPAAPVKNASFTYVIKMVDSTDHATPETGLTIAMTRSLDGAAFGAATGVVTEISAGHYKVAASAADMLGDVVTHRFTATGADDLTIEFKTVS